MAPLRVSTTKSEWLPDDPTAFVPTRLWKLPFITTWDDSRNQNRPTDSAEEAHLSSLLINDHLSVLQDLPPAVWVTVWVSAASSAESRLWVAVEIVDGRLRTSTSAILRPPAVDLRVSGKAAE